MRLERKEIIVCDGCDKQMEQIDIHAIHQHLTARDMSLPDVWTTLEFCSDCAHKLLPSIKSQLAAPPKPSWWSRIFGGSHV